MIRRKKKLVLYFPQQANPRYEEFASKDLLPLSVLTIAGLPDRDGYDVVIIDGNLYTQEEAHRRVVEACSDALLYGTTGILGYQVLDGLLCSREVKAAHPELPMFIGGWFASVVPEMQLATGLYDAVCLGQGEMTFCDIIAAVESGASLEEVPGLALMVDGEFVRTERRVVVGFNELVNCPWHVLDIAPYRDAQLNQPRVRQSTAVPPGMAGQRVFGINYFGSFGCPEPCAFCCSPEFSGMRWKCMPGDRMADDLCGLQDRWGFQTVRFMDANWGVMEKRTRQFCEGMIANGTPFSYFAFMQANSLTRYKPETLDMLAPGGMFEALIGGETGDEQMMSTIGKHSSDSDNFNAAMLLTERDITQLIFYIIGYPNEEPEAMMRTIDQARRIAVAAPRARPVVWPYRPIPGTVMFDQSIELGYVPPSSIEEWGEFPEYHMGDPNNWPGQIPAHVARTRRLYEHFYSLSLGLTRGHIGWWERRAKERMAGGFSGLARLEAKVFSGYDQAFPRRKKDILPGHLTSSIPA